MYSSTTPHILLSLLFLYYNSVLTWWGYKSLGAQLWLFLFLASCCLCLASLSQCPQTHTVVVSPSLIEKDRGEDYTVSNEKTPSKIHIRIWRKSNVGSRLWKDWFWLCPIFIQCTWCRAHRGEKNWDAIGTVWQREKKYDATVFHKLSTSPKSFSTKSISVPAHFLFTIPRESLWVLHYLEKQSWS